MSHRQDAYGVVARREYLVEYLACKVEVAPHGTVWYHHAFGEACRAGGVVDEGQFVRTLLFVVADHFFPEILWELLSEKLVEVFSRIGKLVRPGNHQ